MIQVKSKIKVYLHMWVKLLINSLISKQYCILFAINNFFSQIHFFPLKNSPFPPFSGCQLWLEKLEKLKKGPFFRYWLEQLKKTSPFAVGLAGKAGILFFPTPFNFYWSTEYNKVDIQNELITFNTYNN